MVILLGLARWTANKSEKVSPFYVRLPIPTCARSYCMRWHPVQRAWLLKRTLECYPDGLLGWRTRLALPAGEPSGGPVSASALPPVRSEVSERRPIVPARVREPEGLARGPSRQLRLLAHVCSGPVEQGQSAAGLRASQRAVEDMSCPKGVHAALRGVGLGSQAEKVDEELVGSDIVAEAILG